MSSEFVAKPSNVWLKTLVAGSRWASPGAGPTEIAIYVGDSERLRFNDGTVFSVDALSPTQAELNAIGLTLALYESVAKVKFEIVAARADADIVWAVTDDQDAGGSLGFAYFPGDSFNPLTGEDQSLIVINRDAYAAAPQSLARGGYDFITFIHEFGHAVGLDHPHDGLPRFPGTSSDDDLGDFSMNQGIHTTMGYNDGWQSAPHGTSPSDLFGYQSGPMALDIAALQYLYGPNGARSAGNNIYPLPAKNAAGTFYTAIWDTGGIDAIRHSGAIPSTIDLRAATLAREAGGGGFVSFAKGVHGGFTIANGAVIENASGSAAADRITGNAVKNALLGNGGADVISGGGGNDRLTGGAGPDRLTGGAGDDQFIYRFAADSSAFADTILDFRHLHDDINLRAIDANQSLAANQNFVFLSGEGSAFAGAGQVRFVHLASGNTRIDASTDADFAAELSILLKGTLALSAADFIL